MCRNISGAFFKMYEVNRNAYIYKTVSIAEKEEYVIQQETNTVYCVPVTQW